MNNNNNFSSKVAVVNDRSLMKVIMSFHINTEKEKNMRKMQLENKFERGISLGSLMQIMYSKLVFEEEIDADVVNYNAFEEMLLQCGIESSDDMYDFNALYLEDILDIYDHTLYIVHLAL